MNRKLKFMLATLIIVLLIVSLVGIILISIMNVQSNQNYNLNSLLGMNGIKPVFYSKDVGSPLGGGWYQDINITVVPSTYNYGRTDASSINVVSENGIGYILPLGNYNVTSIAVYIYGSVNTAKFQLIENNGTANNTLYNSGTIYISSSQYWVNVSLDQFVQSNGNNIYAVFEGVSNLNSFSLNYSSSAYPSGMIPLRMGTAYNDSSYYIYNQYPDMYINFSSPTTTQTAYTYDPSTQIIYHKINTNSTLGTDIIYTPNEWTYLNSSNCTIFSSVSNSYYEFSPTLIPQELFFISNPIWNVTANTSLCDDTFSNNIWYGTSNSPTPFISMNLTAQSSSYISYTGTGTENTFDFWLNPSTSTGTWEYIINQIYSVLVIDGTNMKLQVRTDGGSYIYVSDPLTVGQWVHVTLYLKQNERETVWINGTLTSNQTILGTVNGGQLTCGGGYNGLINNLKVFSGYMPTNTTALNLYLNPLYNPQNSSIWNTFLETGGSTCFDISGNSNNGVITGSGINRVFSAIDSNGDLLNLTSNGYSSAFIDLGSVQDLGNVVFNGNGSGYFSTDRNGNNINGLFSNYVDNVINLSSSRIILVYGNNSNVFVDYVKAITYNPYDSYNLDYSGNSSTGVLYLNATGTIVFDCGYSDIIANSSFPVMLNLYQNGTLVANCSVYNTFVQPVTYDFVQNSYSLNTTGYLSNTSVSFTVHKVDVSSIQWRETGTSFIANEFFVNTPYDLLVTGKWDGSNTTTDNVKISLIPITYTPSYWNEIDNMSFPLLQTYQVYIYPISSNDTLYNFAILGNTYVTNITMSTPNIVIQGITFSKSCFSGHDNILGNVNLYLNQSIAIYPVTVTVSVENEPAVAPSISNCILLNYSSSVSNFYLTPIIQWLGNEKIDISIYSGLNYLASSYNTTVPFELNPTIENFITLYSQPNYTVEQPIIVYYSLFANETSSHQVNVQLYINNIYSQSQNEYVLSAQNITGSFLLNPPLRLSPSGNYWLPTDNASIVVVGDYLATLSTNNLNLPILFYGNLFNFTLTPSILTTDDLSGFTATVSYLFSSQYGNSMPYLATVTVSYAGTTYSPFYYPVSIGSGTIPITVLPAGLQKIGIQNLTVTISTPITSSINSTVQINVVQSSFESMINYVWNWIMTYVPQSANSASNNFNGSIIFSIFAVLICGIIIYYLSRKLSSKFIQIPSYMFQVEPEQTKIQKMRIGSLKQVYGRIKIETGSNRKTKISERKSSSSTKIKSGSSKQKTTRIKMK